MPKIILTRQKLELLKEIKATHPTVSNKTLARLVGLKHHTSVVHALTRTKRQYPDEFDRFNLARLLRDFAYRLEHEYPTP